MNSSVFPASSSLNEYVGPPPILIAASSSEARARAAENAESAGFRVAMVAIEDAVERINIQPDASAIWVEVDHDLGAPFDQLLERIEAGASSGGFPVIISAPSALIDPIVARIQNPAVHLLVDPTPDDRVTTLALATAWTRARTESRNHDISKEPSSARLRQLSDEVGRIAATLARLSGGPGPAPTEMPQPSSVEAPQVSIELIRQIVRARRLRARFFDEELFADPAWDMLLDLLQAEIAQHRVPVSSLCIAAAVPATTALRWIRTMTDAGLFQRRDDPHDGRRVFIELSPRASDAMRHYLAEVGRMCVI